MEPPILSTMTILYNTNLKFDTTKLAESLPINTSIIKVEKKGVIKKGESSKDKIKHRSKKEAKPTNNTGFGHNSITIVMLNNGDGSLPNKEITVKIFKNGVFHLTGVLDEKYDRSCMQILFQILREHYLPTLEDQTDDMQILNRRVVMMNFTTKLTSKQTIPREALHNVIRTSQFNDIISRYTPGVYPGVAVEFSDIGKANIFRTGKINLTCIKSHEECQLLMTRLLGLFEMVMPQKLQLENK
jgi:TATA-box binding protein (TBP) (component of TFIID and TFIIIB)